MSGDAEDCAWRDLSLPWNPLSRFLVPLVEFIEAVDVRQMQVPFGMSGMAYAHDTLTKQQPYREKVRR